LATIKKITVNQYSLKIIQCGILFLLISCKTGITNSSDLTIAKTVEFCELEKHNKELITTEIIYSGVDEYWSAKGNGNCNEDFRNVYLYFDDYYRQKGNKSVVRKLDKIHAEYYKYNAKMTVTGIFQVSPLQENMVINQDTLKTTINGFGHANSYKSRIKIISVDEIKLLEK
jgi:hypothetical protein